MRTVWLLVIAILGLGVIGCGKSEVAVKPGSKIGDVRINLKDGAEMVWVPAGEFTMGSTDVQIAAAVKALPKEDQEDAKWLFDAQKPQHKVSLDGYWMYKCEVTVAQYRKFCEATKREMPAAPKWGWIDTHPMVNVTWKDAADYALWAGCRLPTEAEWEKAARGTDGRKYSWGNDWDSSKCANSVGTGLNSTQPVGSYPAGASPYGCMDMTGNVWEWCADWYDENYYNNSPSRNPKGPTSGIARVLRGGSWSGEDYDNFCCVGRYYSDPTARYSRRGFRCARTP